eukprot:165266_1
MSIFLLETLKKEIVGVENALLIELELKYATRINNLLLQKSMIHSKIQSEFASIIEQLNNIITNHKIKTLITIDTNALRQLIVGENITLTQQHNNIHSSNTTTRVSNGNNIDTTSSQSLHSKTLNGHTNKSVINSNTNNNNNNNNNNISPHSSNNINNVFTVSPITKQQQPIHRSVLASQKTSVTDINKNNMPSFVPLPNISNSRNIFDMTFPSQAAKLTQINKSKINNKSNQNKKTFQENQNQNQHKIIKNKNKNKNGMVTDKSCQRQIIDKLKTNLNFLDGFSYASIPIMNHVHQLLCPYPICKHHTQAFENVHLLQKHIKIVHLKTQHVNVYSGYYKQKQKIFSCNICGKQFQKKLHMNEHRRVHISLKPFECRFKNCLKRFERQLCLYDHYKNNHGLVDLT